MPSAYGYLRLDDVDDTRVASLKADVAAFCAAEGMSLVLTFIDVGADESALTRPGWRALLDALGRRGEAGVVVVPSPAHLAASEAEYALMCGQLRQIGAVLRLMRVVDRARPVGVGIEGPLGAAMRRLGIVQLGEPVLAAPCSPLALPQESVEAMRLGARLFSRVGQAAAVHRFASGLGLSAPQLGVQRAALVLRPGDGDPVMLFNARIVAQEAEAATEYEGCLSFFDYRGAVRRATRIEVEHQTTGGAYLVTVFEGAVARLVAHEIDHLRGQVYLDRMAPGAEPVPIRDYGAN